MIIFDTVSKQFGDSIALDAVSFRVNPGELLMITGASGSGKTTLMRLLTREYVPTSGEIIFEETPLSKIGSGKVHHHRRKIGVVFQDYKLLPDMNVWENIALALSIIGVKEKEIENRVTDLLELVKLTDKAYHFPSQLSGGEAQRVSIARALSTAPKIIFADEPTGNLDNETSKNIIDLLDKINQLGTTIIVTTHDPFVLERLKRSRHLHLEAGKLVKDSEEKTASAKAKAKAEPEEIEEEEENPEKKQEKLEEKETKEVRKEEKTEKKDKKEKEEKERGPRFQLRIPFFSKKKPKTDSADENDKDDEDKESAGQDKEKPKSNKNKKDEEPSITVAVEEL